MLFKRKVKVEERFTIDDPIDLGERRVEGKDRRSFGPPSKFPLVDSENKHVMQDRRSRPERRLNNIIVQESNISLNAKV